MNAVLHLDPESPPCKMVWDEPLSDEQFEALCFANDFFTLERTRDGEIIVHEPAAGGTGDGNAE